MTDIKDKAISISLSSLATLGPVALVVWFVIKPLIIADIKDEILQEVARGPLQTAFKEILLGNINVNRRAIAKLEFDRDHRPETWTQERAGILADRYIEIQSQERAYDAL